ncbi:MAG TPA: HD domain-containing phosphohydrolase [Pyrinomonadaceae bacterium]|jgi:HD-GYP domain-containing protein (c-di-GMP phosphodiesterase class II)
MVMQESLQKKLLHTFAALADLGQEIAGTNDFEEMVRTSLHLLLGTLAIRRGALAEYDETQRLLRFIVVRGLAEQIHEDIPVDDENLESLMSLDSQGVSLIIEDAEPNRFVEKHQTRFDFTRFDLLIPLFVRGHLTGIVLLGKKASGEPFSADDKETISAMARHIGVGLNTHRLMSELERKAEENRRLYDGMRAIYQDTVRAFASAIDLKDKYTQGHSERVGRYSEIIAREMGWSDEEVEGIAIAGYLHDIGKLVVERDIINAPYKIDAQKSSELNRHPAAGFEILSPIRHPYADIPLMARHHHERVDGRGYPDGLKGDEIHIGAKIVNLADSFDAMTTDRPYKRRRIFEDVVEDLRRNTGKQFAVEVVLPFCRAILKELEGQTKDRRIMKMLGRDYMDTERAVPLLQELIKELESGTSVSA